MLTIE